MITPTRVSVYSVVGAASDTGSGQTDEPGSTGHLVGRGSLVAPSVVLAHPPLASDLVEGRVGERLRVGLADAADGPVEVIDVSAVRTVEDESRVLVALELVTASTALIDPVPGAEEAVTGAELAAAAAAHVRGAVAVVGAAALPKPDADDVERGRPAAMARPGLPQPNPVPVPVPDAPDPTHGHPFCKLLGIGCPRRR